MENQLIHRTTGSKLTNITTLDNMAYFALVTDLIKVHGFDVDQTGTLRRIWNDYGLVYIVHVFSRRLIVIATNLVANNN